MAVGDAVSVTSWDGVNNRPNAARSTAANLATSKTVYGIAKAIPGGGGAGTVDVSVAGEAFDASLFPAGSPMLIGTGAGSSHVVATDITQGAAANQCKLIRVHRPNGSEHVVGTCDESGNIIVQPRASTDTSAPHVYNVRAYGAIPSGTMLWDAQFAGALPGSVTLESASLTAADAGKHVYLLGASKNAGTGVVTDLVTTLATAGVGTSTTATAADQQVVDGAAVLWSGADNRPAIEAAIAAIPTTGGVLFFPAAAEGYVITTPLVVPEYVEVRFDQGAVLLLAGTTVTFQGRVIAHPSQHIFGGIVHYADAPALMITGTAGVDPLPTVTGSAALGVYALRVAITLGGVRGVAELEFSDDGGRTRSTHTVPAGGVFPVPSGRPVTVTFPAGTYQDGSTPNPAPPPVLLPRDVYNWGCAGILFTGLARTSEIHAAWFGAALGEGGLRGDDLPTQAAIDSVAPASSATIVLHPTPEGVIAPFFRRSVRVRRGHIIRGSAGTQSDNGTVVYCDHLVTGFVVESLFTSDDGGAGVLAVFRDFAIVSQYGQEPIPTWKSAPRPVAVGDRVCTKSIDAGLPPLEPDPDADTTAEPRYYLEAVVGGATMPLAAPPTNPGPLVGGGIGRDVVDNEVRWRAWVHSGIYAKEQCYVERVRISAFTNAGITYQASASYAYPAGPGFANAGGAASSGIDTCGAGVAVLGADVNNATFTEIACAGIGHNLYGSGLPPAGLKGAIAFWGEAEVGARFVSCTADTTPGGRGAYTSAEGGGFASAGVFMGFHDEGGLGVPHFGAGTIIGGYQSGYTDNTSALVLTQGAVKNFYTRLVLTRIAGTLAELQLPGNGDPSGLENGVLAGATSDVPGFWNLHYGANLLPRYWGLRFGQESCFLAFTVTGAETGDGELNGPSRLWLPQGAFRGTAGGYPDWYEFTGASETTSTYVRGGKRKVGDRYLTPDVVASLGSPAERVVLTEGYDALPNYPGGAPLPVVGIPGDGVNSWSWRSTQAGQERKVFRATTSGNTAGLGEPDVSGAVVPGVSVVVDGEVSWLYLGDVPTFGSVLLGATVTGTDPDGVGVDLTDEVERELVLADGRAYSLRVSVLGRDRGAPATVGRHVYELLVTANGALTIVDPAPPPGPLVGAGTLPAGWAIALGTAGLALRVSCTGAVGSVVDFTARVEATPLPALA
jgi:hypothetical protein